MTTPAFLELQRLVRHVAEELASFRRRAFAAEARVRELERALAEAEARTVQAATPAEATGPAQTTLALDTSPAGSAVGAAAPADSARLEALEAENARLQRRLASAGERTRQLLERVRFLRQQQEQEAAR